MKISKEKPARHHHSASNVYTPTRRLTLEQIQNQANEIYVTRGGMARMVLNDWISAEQEFKQWLDEHQEGLPIIQGGE